MDIAGSTALVTGANRGLGRQLGAQLLARGATVYAGARNPDTVDLPGTKAVQLDITDPASVAAAAEVAGDITLLINNAGSSTGSDLLGGDLEDIRLEMDTHYFGTLSVVRTFAPKMAANGGGSILNILSALSWFSFPAVGAYCAAKSAEWSLTNALRLALAEQNIRIVGLQSRHQFFIGNRILPSFPKGDGARQLTPDHWTRPGTGRRLITHWASRFDEGGQSAPDGAGADALTVGRSFPTKSLQKPENQRPPCAAFRP